MYKHINFHSFLWRWTGGGSPGENGAGGVRETGEERQERAGSGNLTRAKNGRENKKEKRLLLFIAYDTLKNMTPLTFAAFI